MSILSTYLKVKFQKLAEPAEPQLNLYDVYKKEYIPFFFRRRLFNFETLKCGVSWRVTFKGGRCLFQSQKYNPYEISYIFHFLFSNNAML